MKKIIILIIASCCLIGITIPIQSRIDSALFGGSSKPPNPPEKEEVSAWFDANYELLNELKEIGVRHTSLRRAEPALRKYTNYYGTPTDEDKIAEERVFEIVDELKVDFVAYSRTYPEFNNLSFMSVPSYRWGLCLGGVSTMIVYVDDKESIDQILENGHKVVFTALSKDGWYIEESDTR